MAKLEYDVDTRPCEPGDIVIVHEAGISDRLGTVRSVKWSFATGWWADVEYDDGMTWSIPAQFIVT